MLSLCDHRDCSMSGFPILPYLQEFAQIHVHWVSDAFLPSYPLSSPSPPAPNPSQHQICRWHHPYGRKWRGTKKLLDESEIGEWKSWLKVQHLENKDHGIQSHHFMGHRGGNSGNSVRLYFFWGGGGPPKSLQMVTAAMKSKDAYSLEGKLWPT